MRMPQGPEWIIILVLILLLFGAKRLPDMARGLGRSMRILKAETKGLHDDDTTDPVAPTPKPAALPEAPTTAVPGDVPDQTSQQRSTSP